MNAHRFEIAVPADGKLSICLPEAFWASDVEVTIARSAGDAAKRGNRGVCESCTRPTLECEECLKEMDREYLELIDSLRGSIPGPIDYDSIRDETDREFTPGARGFYIVPPLPIDNTNLRAEVGREL